MSEFETADNAFAERFFAGHFARRGATTPVLGVGAGRLAGRPSAAGSIASPPAGVFAAGGAGRRSGRGRVLRDHRGGRTLFAWARSPAFEPEPHPAGEVPLPWLAPIDTPFRPWLLLVILPVGRAVHRLDRLHLRSRSRRARDRRGDRGLSQAARRDCGRACRSSKSSPAPSRWASGGSGGREGPIAQIGAGFGSFLAGCHAAAAGRTARADGGRHGGRHRRDLSRAVGRLALCRRSALPLARVRVGGDHAGRAGQRRQLQHVRRDLWLAAAVRDSEARIQRSGWNWWPIWCWRLWAAFLAMLYTRSFYAITRWFRRSPLPRKTRPAVGCAFDRRAWRWSSTLASAGTRSCWAFSASAMEPCNGHSKPTERKPSRCCWRLRWVRSSPRA